MPTYSSISGHAKIKQISVAKQQTAFEKAMREGLKSAAKLWQRKFAPGHFAPAAAAKYGYKPRTPAYERRKKRVKGHNVPLVWSGTTRRTVKTRFAEPSVRKSKDGVFHVSLNLGVRIFARQGELLETTPAEMDEMAEEVLRIVEPALYDKANIEEQRV